MLSLFLSLLLSKAALGSQQHLDRNLAYSSPLSKYPEFAHDTSIIHKRHVTHAKRQVVNAEAYSDDHYPTFYGAEFGNSPFVWSGGINFTHSVASGDPLDTSILLWTRAAPYTAGSNGGPDASIPVCVSYRIFSSTDFSQPPIDSAQAFTSYDVDFTVKLEATGLKPDSYYWYQFADCTNPATVSPIGKTRTISSPDTPADKVNGGKALTLGVFSCSQYQNGYFNAYGVAAHNTSADIFVHLGDYIYEDVGNGAPIGRAVLGRELATLFDYRQRFSQYKTDASLRYAHEIAPWITIWDDHEVADNAWKAGTAHSNDIPAEQGCTWSPSGACFSDRKMAAVRAYHEYMPIRQVDSDNKLRIWRNFQIGKLLDLTMLDTRNYNRDDTDIYRNTIGVAEVHNYVNRTNMGADQEAWFHSTLQESVNRGALWRLIGQQIVFTQIGYGFSGTGLYNYDSWDGYTESRSRIYNWIYQNDVKNTIVLSGDSHANWVSDLSRPNDKSVYDPTTGVGAVGVEFAGTAVTSSSPFALGKQHVAPEVANAASLLLVKTTADLQWSEGSYRGFYTLKIDTQEAVATYYGMKDISTQNLDHFIMAQFHVKNGANRLTRPVAGGSVAGGVLKHKA